MKKVLFPLAIAATILSSGCSPPTIDASSDETMKASVARVRESLPEEDRERFDEALQLVCLGGWSLDDLAVNVMADDFDFEIPTPDKGQADGKTGNEILALADEIKKEQEVKRREQTLQEISELESKLQEAEAARSELSKFKVNRSRFYKRTKKYSLPERVIELSVENGTDYPVSRAFFVGTLASPDRSIPWLKDSFNYQIAGGLEPGETATWKLAPTMFSDWGTVNAPSDAILTVEVVKLNGVDDETLFDAEGLDEFEKERLGSLKAEYLTE